MYAPIESCHNPSVQMKKKSGPASTIPGHIIPNIPSTVENNWKLAVKQYNNGDPERGLTLALKDWPLSWYTGSDSRTYGMKQNQWRLVAEAFKWSVSLQLGRCFGTSLFTYDGDEWQSVKGGIAVVQDEDEILLYWCSRPIIEAFGYHCHNAPGDAEAELAVMNQMGIIDAVLTRDADIFPLGAKCVLHINVDETTEVKLVVDIFHADVISEKLGLT
uniref:XPG-I domain-containing protein n=1 Tax=Moniliophthora roreri TaxID=221103 RepID=A0A0W0F1G5_MONRR